MASGRIRHGRSTPKDVRVWLSGSAPSHKSTGRLAVGTRSKPVGGIDATPEMAEEAAPPETKAEESKADEAKAAEPEAKEAPPP